MDPSPEDQTSPNLLFLLEHISSFVKLYLQEGEKILLNCDAQPSFQAIRQALEQITIEDIGITAKTIGFFFQPQKICGIKVLEEDFASISVFCLSKDMKLSYHDHPHMAVLSKVLFGELERTSVDLINEDDFLKKKTKKKVSQTKNNEKKRFLKRKRPNFKGKNRFLGNIVNKDVVKSPTIMRLTPIIENIHSFKAKTDCILFDILIPNYDNLMRQCRFYREIESQMIPVLNVAKKLKNDLNNEKNFEKNEKFNEKKNNKNIENNNEKNDEKNHEKNKEKNNDKTNEKTNEKNDELNDQKNNKNHYFVDKNHDLLEGTIIFEEIEEPDEIASFVVVAFPRALALKLKE